MAPSRRAFPVTARGKEAAALALHRFGFGPTRDSIAALAGDPRGALLSDIDRPGAASLASSLPSSSRAAREVSDFRAEEQAKKSSRSGPKSPRKPTLPRPISTVARRRRQRRALPHRRKTTPRTGRGRQHLNHRYRSRFLRTKPPPATRRR